MKMHGLARVGGRAGRRAAPHLWTPTAFNGGVGGHGWKWHHSSACLISGVDEHRASPAQSKYTCSSNMSLSESEVTNQSATWPTHEILLHVTRCSCRCSSCAHFMSSYVSSKQSKVKIPSRKSPKITCSHTLLSCGYSDFVR